MPVNECCNHCEKELHEGKGIIHDMSGSVSFCDDDCLADNVRKQPRYYIDLLLENELFEKITYEK